MTVNDFGPIYRETMMGNLPVEPWNTFSNLIFLFTFLYWSYRCRYSFKKYPLITFSLPILLTGYVGGTVYHATRSHWAWLVMDYFPIYILAITLALVFWSRLLGSMKTVVFKIIFPFTILIKMTSHLPISVNAEVSLDYILLACVTAPPIIIYGAYRAKEYNNSLVYASFFFILAIVSRSLDATVFGAFFPMGTHWIWHLCGGLTTFFMFKFMYDDTNHCRAA